MTDPVFLIAVGGLGLWVIVSVETHRGIRRADLKEEKALLEEFGPTPNDVLAIQR